MTITVQGLSKVYRGNAEPAVREAVFTAPQGAITALVGPSGSGKTSLLRLIAGLEEPDAGAVFIDGKDSTRTPVQKRGVGFVFQGYALFNHLTVRQNVAVGLQIQRLTRPEIGSRVDELLDLVELSELADRHPGHLSGGQRQRVAFARALAIRPTVLLLDEPFGALDTRVRIELRGWLHQLHDRMKLTTLIVTHDQEEALALSQQVVVMNEGRVVQTGTPDHVYDHPANAFVASFIGTSTKLRSKVLAGKAAVGNLSVDAPSGAVEGSTVQAFVRPHEVKLSRPAPSTSPVALARVLAFNRVGSHVRVDLRLSSDEEISVQMLKSELDALRLVVGDPVMVDVAGAKVFVADYAI